MGDPMMDQVRAVPHWLFWRSDDDVKIDSAMHDATARKVISNNLLRICYFFHDNMHD